MTAVTLRNLRGLPAQFLRSGRAISVGVFKKGETGEAALAREIREELDTEIEVHQLIKTVEHDYPEFHLVMHCFRCSVVRGDLILKEHEAAKWLTKDSLLSVKWLPADLKIIDSVSNML